MYQVFQNNIPADSTGFPEIKNECWKNSKFPTKREAEIYAYRWTYDDHWVNDDEIGEMELDKEYSPPLMMKIVFIDQENTMKTDSTNQENTMKTDSTNQENTMKTISFQDILEYIVGKENVFLMGSRFFDIHSEKSDYDFCVFNDQDNDPLNHYLFKTLNEIGFNPQYVKNENYGENYDHIGIGSKIDIIVVHNKLVFNKKHEQHIKIKKVLESELLFKFVRDLKTKLTGKEIFRSLCKAYLNEESI